MAPPRTFDYDLLKNLLRTAPAWPYAMYADVLTTAARETDPHAPRVKPDAVRRAVSQYRDSWAEEGILIPPKGVVHSELMPPLGSVAANHRMATELRYLRQVARARKGEEPAPGDDTIVRRQALRWADRLRVNQEIVDLTENGIPYTRPARPDELDQSGEPVELAAWALPGWTRPRRHDRRRGSR